MSEEKNAVPKSAGDEAAASAETNAQRAQKERDDFRRDMFRYKEERNKLSEELETARREGRLIDEEKRVEYARMAEQAQKAEENAAALSEQIRATLAVHQDEVGRVSAERDALRRELAGFRKRSEVVRLAQEAGAVHPDDVARMLEKDAVASDADEHALDALVADFLARRPEYLRADVKTMRFGSGSSKSELSAGARFVGSGRRMSGQMLAARMLDGR